MSQIPVPATCLFAQVTPITQLGVVVNSNSLEGQLIGNPALLADRRVIRCSLGRSARLTIKWEAPDYQLVLSFNSSLPKAAAQPEKKFEEKVTKLHHRLQGWSIDLIDMKFTVVFQKSSTLAQWLVKMLKLLQQVKLAMSCRSQTCLGRRLLQISRPDCEGYFSSDGFTLTILEVLLLGVILSLCVILWILGHIVRLRAPMCD